MRANNAFAIAIIISIFLVGGGLALRTFGTRGEDAVARMNSDERAILGKLLSLRRGMSYEEVISVMGAPDDEGPLGMRPRWNVGGSPLNGVAVYIFADGAHHFTWISIGRFVYDGQLRTLAVREYTPGR